MAIYKDICRVLKHDDYAREVYRFEGARTRSSFNINDEVSGDYIYFSKSLDHHKYFTVKRIRQMLNNLLLEEYGFPLSNNSLHDHNNYHKIRDLVLYSDNIKELHSYRLVCASPFEELIKDNYQYNHDKKSGTRGIERVDRRVYGGGYGVSDEWKQLMVYLTMFSGSHKITRRDLLELIKNMRTTNRISRKSNIDFLFSDDSKYAYDINELVFSDFNKYNIINALESILDKGLALPESELSRHPSKTIKGVVNEYEKGRVKTLELLGRRKY